MDKKSNVLEGDGISEELFNLLWTKDELNFGPSINIPDTIIFKYGQPISWYFTASNGKLRKKNRQNLMLTKMEHEFTKYVLGYDVIATFLCTYNDEESVNPSIRRSTVEFLDQKSFVDFLYNRSKSSNGILQRFVEPKGTKNEIVRAIWSPKVCLLERSENVHQLHDHRYGLYERCITYEGPEFYSVSTPIRGPVLAGQIQKICESIVSHISEVTFGQISISRIVVYFKVDSRDKVWLLHSTSVRSAANILQQYDNEANIERSLINISGTITLPESVHLSTFPTYDKNKVRDSHVRCISCGTDGLETLRHPITYKSIIKHYDHIIQLVTSIGGAASLESSLNFPPDPEILEAAGGVGFGCLELVVENECSPKSEEEKDERYNSLRIPPIIRFLHPKLTYVSFSRCRNDPLFHYKNVNVCEECYLVYAEFTTMLLRVGGSLSKLLGHDPANSTIGNASTSSVSAGASVTSSLTGTHRPNSSDWRALSAVQRSRSELLSPGKSSSIGSSQRQYRDDSSTINSFSRRPPTIPEPIRKVVHPLNKKKAVTGTESQLQFQSSSMLDNDNSYNSRMELYDPMEVKAMVVEREKQFFKDISRNAQLKDNHPLMHLITAQHKLSLADEQSGVLTNNTASKSESVFGSKYGRQSGDHFDKFGAYKEEMKYISGKVQLEALKKSKAKSDSKLKASVSAPAIVTASSQTHLDFLNEVMSKLGQEVEDFKQLPAFQKNRRNSGDSTDPSRVTSPYKETRDKKKQHNKATKKSLESTSTVDSSIAQDVS